MECNKKNCPLVGNNENCDIRDCKWRTEDATCKDAVSREWLLDELEQMNAAFFYELKESTHEMYGQMKRMLRDAPSVTVEPKHGEWIYHEDYHTCSVCGVDWVFTDGTDGSDFCPHCGARMIAKDTNVPNKEGADDE